MAKSIFINLLHTEEKEAGLAAAISALSSGEESPAVQAVEPAAFGTIPGAPFAYWASERLRSLFQTLPPFEGMGRTAKQGLATADDFRFVRAWWEVPADKIVTGRAETTQGEFRTQTFQGKRWIAFAKGGAYSPYFADLHLVVNWERDGQEIRGFKDPVTGRTYSRPQGTDYYFRPGLTWPRRTNGLSFRALPAGSIFADKGPACFSKDSVDQLLCIAGVINSDTFSALVQAMVARVALAQSFEVGLVQKVPIPPLDRTSSEELHRAASTSVSIKRRLATADESTHLYCLPPLLQASGDSLLQRLASWNEKISMDRQILADCQHQINEVSLTLYGLVESDLSTSSSLTQTMIVQTPIEEDDETEDTNGGPGDAESAAIDLISHLLGLLFGRWDIRTNLSAVAETEKINTFAPLAPCSPGMLSESDGLPTNQNNLPEYPLDIAWSGMLPTDEGHANDIVARLRLALSLVFSNPHAVEKELCQFLRVKDLGTWLDSKFFPVHIKRYSKSKRRAPIYWQLRSPKKYYGLWLYFPRLTKDTLYVALRDYVGPKLAHEEDILLGLRAQLTEAKLNGIRDEGIAHQAEAQEEVVQDVAAFRDELKAIADAGYDPDLNDGVLINIAPLHKLVPWKEAAACYKELKAGKYSWSSMHQRYIFR